MRAVAPDEAELASRIRARIAEKDEVFAEQPHRHWLVGHLLAEPDRPPIAAQQRAHRRARPDPRQQFVFGFIHISSRGRIVASPARGCNFFGWVLSVSGE